MTMEPPAPRQPGRPSARGHGDRLAAVASIHARRHRREIRLLDGLRSQGRGHASPFQPNPAAARAPWPAASAASPRRSRAPEPPARGSGLQGSRARRRSAPARTAGPAPRARRRPAREDRRAYEGRRDRPAARAARVGSFGGSRMLARIATRRATLCSQAPSEPSDPERAGLAHQDQEGRLEGVFDVPRVFQDAPADRQHHRPVPRHQDREGLLVAPARESLQQHRVRMAHAGAAVVEPLDPDERTRPVG